MDNANTAGQAKRAVYEELARGRKTLNLVIAIDGALSLLQIDPFSPAALEAVLSMNDAAWASAEAQANVAPSSEQTRGMVIDVFTRRVEIRAALNRIPLRSVAR